MQRTVVLLSMVFLVSGLSAAPVQVDATTAATMNNSCKITSLTSISNSFTVNWTEKRTDGTMVLTYGISDPPTTSKVVSASERTTHSITISGLQPTTKYYILLTATKAGETPYGANGTITTGNSTAVKNMEQIRPNMININRSRSGITISGVDVFSQGTTIKLYNAVGALIVSEKITESRETQQVFLKTANIISGNYFVRILTEKKVIEQHLLIN